MPGYYRLRLPRADETFIDGTLLDLCARIIVLKEEPGQDVEYIEEVLNHEFLHLAILGLEGGLVSEALDSISCWTRGRDDKSHLAFQGRKRFIFQLPNCDVNEEVWK